VQIGAAEAAGIDANQNVVGFNLRFRHFLVQDAKAASERIE
jgi:hypothetical protein